MRVNVLADREDEVFLVVGFVDEGDRVQQRPQRTRVGRVAEFGEIRGIPTKHKAIRVIAIHTGEEVVVPPPLVSGLCAVATTGESTTAAPAWRGRRRIVLLNNAEVDEERRREEEECFLHKKHRWLV